jgi:hypothetical protein
MYKHFTKVEEEAAETQEEAEAKAVGVEAEKISPLPHP